MTLPKVEWKIKIWFKGHAINYAFYCWLAHRSLKTSDAF